MLAQGAIEQIIPRKYLILQYFRREISGKYCRKYCNTSMLGIYHMGHIRIRQCRNIRHHTDDMIGKTDH